MSAHTPPSEKNQTFSCDFCNIPVYKMPPDPTPRTPHTAHRTPHHTLIRHTSHVTRQEHTPPHHHLSLTHATHHSSHHHNCRWNSQEEHFVVLFTFLQFHCYKFFSKLYSSSCLQWFSWNNTLLSKIGLKYTALLVVQYCRWWVCILFT